MFLLATGPAIIVALLCRTLRENPQFAEQKSYAGAAPQERPAPFAMIFRREQRQNTLVLALGRLTNRMAIQTFSVLGTTVAVSGKGVKATDTLLLVVASNLVAALPVPRLAR